MPDDTSLPPKTSDTCYSVSELTRQIQDKLESGFDPLWLQGELSNFTAHSSGHWYFTLKDSAAQIRAVMFRSQAQKMPFLPKTGMEVRVYGQITVYKTRGEYQIMCQEMEKCGRGALQEEFERRKQQLKQEGIFENHRPLPFLPKHIGIISSPTGAAIRDILNILNRRHKGLKVSLIPALVQGEQAPESLLKALTLARKVPGLDVLILTRGGGSLEDLWAFNSEELARAIYTFPKPVISAVGHEIDFSLADFAADLRAPTPSAAAELVVQNARELLNTMQKLHIQLTQNITREIKHRRQKLQTLQKSLISPQKKLQEHQQHLDELLSRLQQTSWQFHQSKREKLSHFKALLDGYSPLKVLERGYVLVQKKQQTIHQLSQLKKGDEVKLQFAKGQAIAHIINLKPH